MKPFLVHLGDPIYDPSASPSFVMPGLVPGIHGLFASTLKDVNAQELASRVPFLLFCASRVDPTCGDKPGHDAAV
ncbi:hypothetical protein, partial [Bradyrhizobium sp.]|uniref:hypothetical protein n=1 Tax=Bradyrhizobium sp. TaxID=376 RepID=UPI003BB09B6E